MTSVHSSHPLSTILVKTASLDAPLSTNDIKRYHCIHKLKSIRKVCISWGYFCLYFLDSAFIQHVFDLTHGLHNLFDCWLHRIFPQCRIHHQVIALLHVFSNTPVFSFLCMGYKVFKVLSSTGTQSAKTSLLMHFRYHNGPLDFFRSFFVPFGGITI